MKITSVIIALLAAGLMGCTATVVPTPVSGGTDRTVVERNNTHTTTVVPAQPTNIKVTVPAPAAPPQTNVKVTTETRP